MSEFRTAEDLMRLEPASDAFPAPIPTQAVSNREFLPSPSKAAQAEVETPINPAAPESGNALIRP
jgi:hypothetical protein